MTKQQAKSDERPLSELHKILREKYHFETPEIFTSKKQAEEVIKKLDAKAKVTVVGDTKADKRHYASKAAAMKAKLDAQPKIRMLIPLTGKEKKGLASESVILNGYRTDWPKGEYINVPEQIADVLSDSLQQTSEAGKEFLADRTTEVENALTP